MTTHPSAAATPNFTVPAAQVEAIRNYIDRQDADRPDGMPRLRAATGVGEAPSPALDNPMVEHLIFVAEGFLSAGMPPENALAWAVVNAWMEGHIEGAQAHHGR